jgi:hypothetical protein
MKNRSNPEESDALFLFPELAESTRPALKSTPSQHPVSKKKQKFSPESLPAAMPADQAKAKDDALAQQRRREKMTAKNLVRYETWLPAGVLLRIKARAEDKKTTAQEIGAKALVDAFY